MSRHQHIYRAQPGAGWTCIHCGRWTVSTPPPEQRASYRERKQEEPERPTGVRIVHPDGQETPLELVYDGMDGDGIHIWVADQGLWPGDVVRAEKLPARTSIVFRDLP